MEQFLASIESRAFQMARIATGCDQDALDIVQDVMLNLVQTYSHKPASDWKPLFYRILQNRITDFHCKKTLTGRIFAWIGIAPSADDDEPSIDNLVDPHAILPEDILHNTRFSEVLISALERLPHRQQQAFLLRIWEGLSVKETAAAMECSEGSVKTHLSRAINNLKQQLILHEFTGLEHE